MDDKQDFYGPRGLTGESCRLEDMEGLEKCNWVREHFGVAREGDVSGTAAADNIKEAAQTDTGAWLVPQALLMTVAFAEVMVLPENIADKAPDGFPYEIPFRKFMTVLYALCFLGAGYLSMLKVMHSTSRIIVMTGTPAHKFALSCPNEIHQHPLAWRALENVSRLLAFWRPLSGLATVISTILHLMGIGYSIGLYLTQGWLIAAPVFVFVQCVYKSLNDTVDTTFRLGSQWRDGYKEKHNWKRFEKKKESEHIHRHSPIVHGSNTTKKQVI